MTDPDTNATTSSDRLKNSVGPNNASTARTIPHYFSALPATIDSITDIAPGIRLVSVRSQTANPLWLAGQYIELSFAGLPPRPYSIASAPHTGILEFHVRDTQGGGVSSHIVTHMKPGDPVTLRGPFGHAAMIPGDDAPLLLIAGGMGLSPLKALVDDALHKHHRGPISLYWGVKTPADLYLGDYFDQLQHRHAHFTFVPVIEDISGETIASKVRVSLADLSSTRIYLAGSPDMIQATLPHLQAQGAKANMIHGDDLALSPSWPPVQTTPTPEESSP